MAGFVRWQPGKKRALLVIANLQTGPSSSFQIRLPALVASSAGLGATVQAKVLLGSPTILSVADPVNAGIQLQLANQRSAVVELG
jgi:hypothetical protein